MKIKRITSLLLCIITIMVSAADISAAEAENDNLTTVMEDTKNYLLNTVTDPTVASIGGEWAVIGLKRCGLNVPQEFFERYFNNVTEYVKSKDGVLHSRKYTEYSRVILALAAIGKDPQNTAGYNLVTPILDYDKTSAQGINGSVWALIALNAIDYKDDEIKNRYIADILAKEKQGGGWALSDSASIGDADVTSMAIIALSPFDEKPNVKNAVNRGISFVSEIQNEKGGYTAYNAETAESCAQVITALSAAGIGLDDPRFVKNGHSLFDNLMYFKQTDGSFSHTDTSNLMATEQCFYAMVAAKRARDGKSFLFNMWDEDKAKDERIPHISVPKVVNDDKTFDDIKTSVSKEKIEELARRGIINGISDTEFLPNNNVSRGEFAAITVRAFGLKIMGENVFEDVFADDWFCESVNTAYAWGIVKGVSQNRFNPNGNITKEEAAVMLERAAMLCGLVNDMNDTSVKTMTKNISENGGISDWAIKSVAFCIKEGIINNVDGFVSYDFAKRYEIADMLYNLLKGQKLI